MRQRQGHQRLKHLPERLDQPVDGAEYDEGQAVTFRAAVDDDQTPAEELEVLAWSGIDDDGDAAPDGYGTSSTTSSDIACGSTGTWRSGCTASWFSCSTSSASTRTQTCR